MDENKILYGASFSPLEMDDEDLEGQQEDSSTQYDMADVIKNIGTEEFKVSYMSVISEIKLLSIDYQKMFCLNILEKIEELYDFQFVPKPELENQLQINYIYELLEFLEYDHIEFVGDVWKFLELDIKDDIEKLVNRNSDKVISEIENQIETRDFSEMISMFLRTYNKYDMISLFIKWSKKDRMLIYLRILEGEHGE